MLEIRGLIKDFGRNRVVQDLSMTVSDGEFCVILGPSGCGKTTLLRMIAGLEKLDAGSISMGGVDWTNLPPQKRDVAMVFQQYALYPHRSVKGNIEYPLRLRRMAPEVRKERVDEVAHFLGITALLDRKPRQLSGGEAQRVALARALVRKPACFLMDEPLSNLDAQLRVAARVEIKRLQRDARVTTVYVTHDQEEAVALADRIGIMEKGRLVQIGSPDELFVHPANAFVARFLGKPAINVFQGLAEPTEHGCFLVTLESALGRDPGMAVRFPTLSRNKHKLLVGIRPRHVEVAGLSSDGSAAGPWELHGDLILSEGLDPDYVLHYSTAAGIVLACADRKPIENAGRLLLSCEKVLFFDADTETRIEHEMD